MAHWFAPVVEFAAIDCEAATWNAVAAWNEEEEANHFAVLELARTTREFRPRLSYHYLPNA
jgi:hypothetical protein